MELLNAEGRGLRAGPRSQGSRRLWRRAARGGGVSSYLQTRLGNSRACPVLGYSRLELS